jgi:Zn-dependent protease
LLYLFLMISDNTVLLVSLSLVVIAISITVHEFMHGIVGYWLGDDTAKQAGRLSLNPIHHIDPFATVLLPVILVALGQPPFGAAKPVPFNPLKVKWEEFGAAIIAVAGPLSNLVLAALGAVVLRFAGGYNSDVFITFWWLFITINVGFFIFNLIPFPPLDGSRVLYAFAPEPLQRIMEQIESFGLIAIAVFILLLFPFISPILQSINREVISILLGI